MIEINGMKVETDTLQSLEELLQDVCLQADELTVLMIDGEIVRYAEVAHRPVADGTIIRIMQIVSGG